MDVIYFAHMLIKRLRITSSLIPSLQSTWPASNTSLVSCCSLIITASLPFPNGFSPFHFISCPLLFYSNSTCLQISTLHNIATALQLYRFILISNLTYSFAQTDLWTVIYKIGRLNRWNSNRSVVTRVWVGTYKNHVTTNWSF